MCLLAAGAGVARPAPPSVEELKSAVKQREQDFRRAKIGLTVARIRLARSQGNTDVAAKECRTLLREYEADLKVLQGEAERGRLCTDVNLRYAEGEVAVARAWLADAENDQAALRTELPKVIVYYEWEIQGIKELADDKAIDDDVAAEGVSKDETDLKWARERLGQMEICERDVIGGHFTISKIAVFDDDL